MKEFLAAFPPNLYDGLDIGGADLGARGFGTVPILIANIIEILLMLAGMIAVISLVVAGIQYITSEGNPQRTQAAKQRILMTIVGLVLVTGAYIIVEFIAGQFK